LVEAYVLDRLPPAEQAAVERMLASDASLRELRNATELRLHQLALAQAEAPPPALRARVLSAVDAAIAASGAPVPTASAPQAHTLAGPGAWMPGRWMVAASTVVALVSIAGLLYTVQRQGQLEQRLESRLADLQAQSGTLAQVVQRTSVQALNAQTEIRLTADGFRRVELATVPGAQGGSAIVYWSAQRGETYFVGQLPPVPEGKQYQLWALHNGQPIDAGLLGIVPNGILEPMKQIPQAQAFAVTLEPVGGSPNPTTQAMMVMGRLN